MSLYCIKCWKFTNSKNIIEIKREIDRTINFRSYCVDCGVRKYEKLYDGKENVGKLIPLPKCAACDSKISRLIKNQKVTGLLSSLGLKTLLSKIPLSGEFLF